MGNPCKRGHDGLRLKSGGCAHCGREKAAAKRAADPEAAKAALRAWYQKNAEAAKAKASDWYLENKERAAENKREWNDRNREKKRAYAKAWVSRNPDKAREIQRAARAKKREAYASSERARCATRRARLKGAKGTLSKSDIDEIATLQKGKCACCGKVKKLTVDHIIPLVRGGEHTKRNIQMACTSCNSAKGGKDPIEFFRGKGLLI